MTSLAVRAWRTGAALAAAFALAAPAAAQGAPDLTLTGVMTGADHETYREVPFRVPAGVDAVTVEFAYEGKDERSVIDLGLRDPERFRGWSGGNKARFTVSETYATPSYLPGPLPAGEWKLILGAPNMRKTARAPYVAKVFFEHGFTGFAAAPLKAGPGWYRGDLHMHTAHSDGSCASQAGVKVPCPLFKTTEAAAARGLDFIAVTEHNTTAHHQDLAELQPYYDRLLLIPGREITTFFGHANVFGVVAPLDFQLGSPRAPTVDAILDEVERAGGLISINHPASPSGELCMGCGWTAQTDFARIPAIEAINGGTMAQTGAADGAFSGVPYWEARLDAGFRITAVGGSDNHEAPRDPAQPSSVGAPTTVVHAEALSQPAILAALRAGHVFVDVEGTRDRLLEVAATADAARAAMGDILVAPAGARVEIRVRTAAVAGGHLQVEGPLKARVALAATALPAASEQLLAFVSDGATAWLRVDVRGPDGRLWLLGNPVYLTPAAR